MVVWCKKMRGRRGSKKKPTEEIIGLVCEGIRDCGFVKYVLADCGLTEEDHYRWMSLGAEHPETAFGEYARSVQVARNEAVREGIHRIKSHGAKDWRAMAWWVERLDPGTLSEKHRVEVSGGVAVGVAALEQRLEELSDEEFAAIDAIMERRGASNALADAESQEEPPALREDDDAGLPG